MESKWIAHWEKGKKQKVYLCLCACMLMWMQEPVHMYVCAMYIHIQLCAHLHGNTYVLIHVFKNGV